MKSVLISIKPKWCELIVQGKKTIEVRKTVPKLRNQVKCYIYCTKEPMQGIMKYLHINSGYGKEIGITSIWSNPNDVVVNESTRNEFIALAAHGKVIGEFILDEIITFEPRIYKDDGSLPWDSDCIIYACDKRACLTGKQFEEYGKGKTLYGWHISQLKIYDKPKELSEFSRYGKCNSCKSGYISEACPFDENCKVLIPFNKPPQSWCYVEVEE